MELNRRKSVLWGSILLLILIGASCIWLTHKRPPMFKGKSMQAWLETKSVAVATLTTASMAPVSTAMASPGVNPANSALITRMEQEIADADAALAAIGVESIPWIVQLLYARDSKVELEIEKLVSWQSLVRFQFVTADEKREQALWALGRLQPKAVNAFPGLVIPAVIACARGTNRLHLEAIGQLRGFQITSPETIAPFISGLKDPDTEIQKVCATTLLEFGSASNAWAQESQAVLLRRVIPTLRSFVADHTYVGEADWVQLLPDWPESDAASSLLVELIQRSYGLSRAKAITTLTKMHRDPDFVLPILIRELRLGNPGSKRAAAYCLGQYGPEAKSAIPTILELLAEDKAATPGSNLEDLLTVSRSLKLALLKIDPDAAAKADIKLADVSK